MLSICEKLAVVTDDSVFSYLKVLKFIRSAKWVYFTPQNVAHLFGLIYKMG